MGASTAGDCNLLESQLRLPTIASTVHHVKPMGASTAGDCNSLESPECIFPHEHSVNCLLEALSHWNHFEYEGSVPPSGY